jgi:hypothetical protein
MFKNDTVSPERTPNAVRSMWWRVLHSERGDVGDGGDQGAGDQGAGDQGAGDQGAGGGETWRDSLPDNIKANPIFSKYNSANEALSAFVDVQKLIGPEKIIMPGKDADEKEWNERVFDRLGRPKKPEEYPLPTDLEIPKELPISDKLIQGFREQAHKLGVLPKQFQGMYKWFMNEQIAAYNDSVNGSKAKAEESRAKLRTEWGAAFDQNLAVAEKVLQSYGDPETVNFIKQKGLNTDTNFVKFLHNIGKVLSEDQLTGKPATLTMSPEEAVSEISKMNNDPNNPIHKADHPEHDAAMKKREMLYRMAYPNG